MQDKKNQILRALAKVIRKRRGKISITQLALSADVSKSIWSMIEKANRDTQLTTFFRIAESLNMQPSRLLYEVEKELGDEFTSIS